MTSDIKGNSNPSLLEKSVREKHFHGKFLWHNSDGDEVWECSCGETVVLPQKGDNE